MILRCRRCRAFSLSRWGILSCDYCPSWDVVVVRDYTKGGM